MIVDSFVYIHRQQEHGSLATRKKGGGRELRREGREREGEQKEV